MLTGNETVRAGYEFVSFNLHKLPNADLNNHERIRQDMMQRDDNLLNHKIV